MALNLPAIIAASTRLTAVIFALFVFSPIASATFTIARCCTLAVRTEFQKYYDEHFPWEVCNFNTEIDYATNETFSSILKPMSWAKQFCRGTEYSDTRQWLQPLAAYISPYIGLLLLCPIGREEPPKHTGKRPLLGRFVSFVRAFWLRAREYIAILGDPASVVFGASSEVYADTVALYRVSSLPIERQRATWVAALAGALKFSPETGWRRDQADHNQHPTSEPKPELKAGSTTAPETIHLVDTNPRSFSPPPPDHPGHHHHPHNRPHSPEDETIHAIALCITARPPFATAILIPVVLMLAVTAATFYDAYAKRGDKDTGLALAYCVWYSWILVPAVAGNCFATVLSPDVARRAFRGVMRFGGKETVVVVPLRERFVNNRFWGNWVGMQGVGGDRERYAEFADGLQRDVWFWVRFCGGQVMGWCCVAVACGAAATIAWTTPTVGLGCRSFNILLYGIFALVNGLLHVFCSWLSVRDKARKNGQVWEGEKGLSSKLRLVDGVRGVYWFLVFANSMVMVLGTLFHLVGVFRTCWCDRLTWNDDTIIELNSKTPQAVDNANRYWISTSYVVFSIMALVCLPAVILRQVISRRMDEAAAKAEE